MPLIKWPNLENTHVSRDQKTQGHTRVDVCPAQVVESPHDHSHGHAKGQSWGQAWYRAALVHCDAGAAARDDQDGGAEELWEDGLVEAERGRLRQVGCHAGHGCKRCRQLGYNGEQKIGNDMIIGMKIGWDCGETSSRGGTSQTYLNSENGIW